MANDTDLIILDSCTFFFTNENGDAEARDVDGSDFADVMEAQEHGNGAGKHWVETTSRSATMWNERKGYRRGTRLMERFNRDFWNVGEPDVQPARVPQRHRVAARQRHRGRRDAALWVRGRSSTRVRGVDRRRRAFANQLPEVFAGFTRDGAGVPIEYPDALKPQSWAAGALLMAIQTLLGLDVVEGRLRSQPCESKKIGRLRLDGVRVRRQSVDVR